ncbi:MAG: hypothetical protein WCK05_07845 [Planctomycetota bacterium]
MASRWNTQESDSSDLMLDTICNVFGSIILMSILIVLQTQAGAARVTAAAEEAATAALDAREVQSRTRQIESQMLGLRQRKEAVEKRFSQVVSPHTGELLKRREAFLRGTADAERQLKAATEDAERVRKESDKIRTAAQDQDRELQDRAEEIEKLKIRLELARKITKAEVRLPLQHDSSAPRQVIYVVEGDRVYEFRTQCDQERLLGLEGERITPKANFGYRLADPRGLSLYVTSLASEDPRTCFLTIFVCGTTASFECFQVARREAVSRGFECGYIPYDPKEGLIVGRGRPPVE